MNNYIIYIDSREKNESIKHLFDNQSEFKIIISKQELGDIIFDGCLIERKTISDFSNSLTKSDFWNKLFQAKSEFSKIFVWIDTTLYQNIKFMSYRNKYIFDSIEGAKVTLDSLDITWREFDKEHASDYFYRYFKKIISDKKYTPKPEVKKRGKSLTELRIQNLMSIPNIGYKNAISLLTKYKTIENIIHISKSNDSDKKMKTINDIFCK